MSDNIKPIAPGLTENVSVFLRDLDQQHPDATSIVAIVSDGAGATMVRLTDQSLSDLCFARAVLDDFIQIHMRTYRT